MLLAGLRCALGVELNCRAVFVYGSMIVWGTLDQRRLSILPMHVK